MVLTKVAYADVDFGKKVPTADEVIEALNPDKANQDLTTDNGSETKTRSIDMSRIKATPKTTSPTTSTKKKSKKPPMTVPNAQTETALSMEIIFGYNSAELTEAAKEQLKPVGQALASGKLSNLSFIVEGHTDAVGGQAYNKTLSEERAASVKAFLVNTFDIQSSQIAIVGKGKSDLLDPNNPASEVNRRVRIIAKK